MPEWSDLVSLIWWAAAIIAATFLRYFARSLYWRATGRG